VRASGLGLLAMLAMIPAGPHDCLSAQDRSVSDLVAALRAADPAARARAACDLRGLGDEAAAAIVPLTAALADGAPVAHDACAQRWWQGAEGDFTSPGEIAASALVAIGRRSYDPLIAALGNPAWIARRNAAWALGALDDTRATAALAAALKDQEAGVRAQAAWALGALDDRDAVEPLIAALKDENRSVKEQAAFALGQIGDNRAADALIALLKDADAQVRQQAAFALSQLR
jgi:HEAT repeat protein